MPGPFFKKPLFHWCKSDYWCENAKFSIPSCSKYYPLSKSPFLRPFFIILTVLCYGTCQMTDISDIGRGKVREVRVNFCDTRLPINSRAKTQSHDVRTTLLRRRFNVLTSFWLEKVSYICNRYTQHCLVSHFDKC